MKLIDIPLNSKGKAPLSRSYGPPWERGVGDALFWLTLLPICTALGVSLAMEGSVMGPILFLVLY